MIRGAPPREQKSFAVRRPVDGRRGSPGDDLHRAVGHRPDIEAHPTVVTALVGQEGKPGAVGRPPRVEIEVTVAVDQLAIDRFVPDFSLLQGITFIERGYPPRV